MLLCTFQELYVQAARSRYARSYNLHSGLRPSLVFKENTFSNDMPHLADSAVSIDSEYCKLTIIKELYSSKLSWESVIVLFDNNWTSNRYNGMLEMYG